VLQTAAAALDLFRALYAVELGNEITAGRAMRSTNDAEYLAGKVSNILGVEQQLPEDVGTKLVESRERLKLAGEIWYEDALVGLFFSVGRLLN
jgi:hypothetical protein